MPSFSILEVEFRISFLFDLLQVWDTAGQERFRSMTSAFFGKAQGALVVFDVSDKDSFENLGGWIEEIEKVHNCGYSMLVRPSYVFIH